jgi:tRNA threonylcarbamoyladenosine biosynthesis protein TsaB
MNLPSKVLAIDTATKYIYLSLILDGKVIDSVYQEGSSNHSVTIMPLIEEILIKNELVLKDIQGIMVGIGPGSYTGVRIGVAIAKMIGYLNEILIYSFSSLALLATASDAENIVAIIDARRGNAFLAQYEQNSGVLKIKKNDILMNLDQFRIETKQPCIEISEGKPDILKIIKSKLYQVVSDVHGLTPNYLQITEAERNRAL